MKIVTYNIQYAKGKDQQIDLSRIVDEVQGADVIALQEVDRFWPRTGLVDQVEQFANAFAGHFWVFGAGVDLHADQISLQNRGARRQFGNMLLSKEPIIASRHHLLPKYGSVTDLSIQRSAIEASIRVNERLIRFYSIHLTHLSAQTRLPQIDLLLDVHRSALQDGFAISGNLSGFDWESGIASQQVASDAILLGDLNCQPDSEEYDRLAGPVSDYGDHIINPVGFVDAWTTAGGDKWQGSTSDVNGKPARLDYAFISTSLRDNIKSCWVDDEAMGSDHQPVWIEMDL